jgi:hypothetical protein
VLFKVLLISCSGKSASVNSPDNSLVFLLIKIVHYLVFTMF